MTITVNGVAVPAQSKNLDTTTVTTGFGLVHRQIIGIADPENPSQYARLTGTSLNVNVTNASLAITAAALPLPTNAATNALQTAGNASLSSIDGKLDALSTLEAKTAEFGTAGTPSADVISVQGVTGGEPVKVDVVQPVVIQPATSEYVYLSANGTTTAKSGAGVLRRIVVGTKGSLLNTLTVYDNTTATGSIIALIDTSEQVGSLNFEVDFTTGLTLVLAGGTAARVTVIFE